MSVDQRFDYESPKVCDYGDLVEMTAAGSDGDCLDLDYNAGTTKSSLTFSSC